MSYRVKTISVFEKQAKRLLRKYPSLKKELRMLVQQLKENANLGVSIGKNCYKIRLAVKSKGTGKSGGTRVITHFVVSDDTIYLLTIYDKADKGTLTHKELETLIALIPE